MLYLLDLFRLHIRSYTTMFVCYNYADTFLHLLKLTKAKLVNSSKNLFYYGGTFTVFWGLILIVSNVWETKLDFWRKRL